VGFEHQLDVCFLSAENYFYILYVLGQPVCILHRYVVYVNYVTSLLRVAHGIPIVLEENC
jgi:hypothetical protein